MTPLPRFSDCSHLNAYKLSVCPDCGTDLYPPRPSPAVEAACGILAGPDTDDVRMCKCGGEHDRFIWRGDPDWWSCGCCDGRVREMTDEEKHDRMRSGPLNYSGELAARIARGADNRAPIRGTVAPIESDFRSCNCTRLEAELARVTADRDRWEAAVRRAYRLLANQGGFVGPGNDKGAREAKEVLRLTLSPGARFAAEPSNTAASTRPEEPHRHLWRGGLDDEVWHCKCGATSRDGKVTEPDA